MNIQLAEGYRHPELAECVPGIRIEVYDRPCFRSYKMIKRPEYEVQWHQVEIWDKTHDEPGHIAQNRIKKLLSAGRVRLKILKKGEMADTIYYVQHAVKFPDPENYTLPKEMLLGIHLSANKLATGERFVLKDGKTELTFVLSSNENKNLHAFSYEGEDRSGTYIQEQLSLGSPLKLIK